MVSAGYTWDSLDKVVDTLVKHKLEFRLWSGADTENNPVFTHAANVDKCVCAKEPKDKSVDVDEPSSVIDEDCEGEVTVRYPPEASKLKALAKWTAPYETIWEVT